MCFQGACGSWTHIDTVVESESDRLAFAAAIGITNTG